jgi:hypothetical protein
LAGAPIEVLGSFICNGCKSLTSLEGAPKKVGYVFKCFECGVKFTEKDVKKFSDVADKIYCEPGGYYA